MLSGSGVEGKGLTSLHLDKETKAILRLRRLRLQQWVPLSGSLICCPYVCGVKVVLRFGGFGFKVEVLRFGVYRVYRVWFGLDISWV